jgi:hypothetical protein
MPNKDVSDLGAHEEVEVGQDGHQEERATQGTIEATTALRTQIFLLK